MLLQLAKYDMRTHIAHMAVLWVYIYMYTHDINGV